MSSCCWHHLTFLTCGVLLQLAELGLEDRVAAKQAVRDGILSILSNDEVGFALSSSVLASPDWEVRPAFFGGSGHYLITPGGLQPPGHRLSSP